MSLKDEGVGYISYEWYGAPSGVMDAQAGGAALTGLDDVLRYFNRQQSKGFSVTPYEIPVLVGAGSWVVVVLGVLAIPGATFFNAYVKKAGEKMAERDFASTGFSDIARKSMDALVKLVRLLKARRGKLDLKSLEVTWNEDSTTAFVKDEDGKIISLPAEYIKWYRDLPQGFLKKLGAPVAPGRTLEIASRQKSGKLDTESLDVQTLESLLYQDEDDEEEFLLPELTHGLEIELEGVITRGNQSTNSIGFQYRGHILNCNPEQGNVRKFKSAMFLHCRILATVNRHVASSARLDYRPTLLISSVTPLQGDDVEQGSLF